MKNIFFLLLFSAILFSCSNDVYDTDSGLQDFTVTIHVDPDYRFSNFTQSLTAFLSDESGSILAITELQIGETLTLTYSRDPSAIYDLSYMKYDYLDFVDEDLFSLTTFQMVSKEIKLSFPYRLYKTRTTKFI